MYVVCNGGAGVVILARTVDVSCLVSCACNWFSVVDLAVLWVCLLHIIFKETCLIYVRIYVYVMLMLFYM